MRLETPLKCCVVKNADEGIPWLGHSLKTTDISEFLFDELFDDNSNMSLQTVINEQPGKLCKHANCIDENNTRTKSVERKVAAVA